MIKAKKSYNQDWDLHPTEAYWFAVKTPSRWEKQVFNRLLLKEIEVYLPLLTTIKKYKKQKIKKVEVPLISSFVFVKIIASEYRTVLETEGVAYFLKDVNLLKAIPDKQIEVLRYVVGEKVQVQKAKFEVGEKVEVVAGNLTGIQGTLVEQKGKSRFIINLFFLDKELVVDIPTSHIRRL